MRSVVWLIYQCGGSFTSRCENHAAEQNIAQPVGGNAQEKIRVMVPPLSPSRE
jgi:hypothetical protein